MLKVVNVIRLYLRDLQSRSFVFVFLFFCYARSVGKEWKTTGTTIKTRKSSCLASEQSSSGLSSSTSEAAKPSG